MNLVTIIGKVKTHSNGNMVIDVDNVLFTVKRTKDLTENISSGDIVGVIGKLDTNNQIQAKHISVF